MSLPLVRLVVLCVALFFAIVALGLGAAVESATETLEDLSFAYASLAIAAAVLTLLSVGPMVALELLRPGGPASWLWVEISVLLVLSILWLATGGATANVLQVLNEFGYCTAGVTGAGGGAGESLCGETQGVAAMGFLSWLLLMGYAGMLLVVGIQAASRGQSDVWTTSVADLGYLQPPVAKKPNSDRV
ncbi:hypothetical protein MIND_01428500 [Mycena indigotica]|uniref:MARVEL domain-containing protein n=1 Tax=Mycena indigotica TaxID=2126181 RepID=A0A8H6RWI7_9AGAR|nr:uncharacterized protein MIND_01428500 [Mycena indigotica]KAF7288619.1 hypothetical protein MIND_01428500 [Mycena indigotica]